MREERGNSIIDITDIQRCMRIILKNYSLKPVKPGRNG
jgi:hypothetical protein